MYKPRFSACFVFVFVFVFVDGVLQALHPPLSYREGVRSVQIARSSAGLVHAPPIGGSRATGGVVPGVSVSPRGQRPGWRRQC